MSRRTAGLSNEEKLRREIAALEARLENETRGRSAYAGESSRRERSASRERTGYVKTIEKKTARKTENVPIVKMDNDKLKLYNPESGRYVEANGATGKELLRTVRREEYAKIVYPSVDDYIESAEALGVSLRSSKPYQVRNRDSSTSGLAETDKAVMFSMNGKSVAVGSNEYLNTLKLAPQLLIDALIATGGEAARIGEALQAELDEGHVGGMNKYYVTGTTSRGIKTPIVVGGRAWAQDILKNLPLGSDYMTVDEKKDMSLQKKEVRSTSSRRPQNLIDVQIAAGNLRKNNTRAPIKYGGPSHIAALKKGESPAYFDNLLEAKAQELGLTNQQVQALKNYAAEQAQAAGVNLSGRRSPSPSRASAVTPARSTPARASPTRSSPARAASPSRSPSRSPLMSEEEEESEEPLVRPTISGAPASRYNRRRTPA